MNSRIRKKIIDRAIYRSMDEYSLVTVMAHARPSFYAAPRREQAESLSWALSQLSVPLKRRRRICRMAIQKLHAPTPSLPAEQPDHA